MASASLCSSVRLLVQQPRQQRGGRRALRVQAAGSTFGEGRNLVPAAGVHAASHVQCNLRLREARACPAAAAAAAAAAAHSAPPAPPSAHQATPSV